MYSSLGDMRKLYVSISEKSREHALAGEHLNTRLMEVENEHATCKGNELKLEELQKELSTKDVSLSKLTADYANLETKLDDLQKSLLSKEDEIVASLAADKSRLEVELQQSKKYIDELKSAQTHVMSKIQYLNTQLKTFSSQAASIKGDFRTYQEETAADNLKIRSYFQNLSKQIFDLIDDEKKKVEAFETEVRHLREQLSTLNGENAKLASEKRNLESSLANESAEKRSLSERLSELANAPETGHDDKSCPYKEKVQEYKKELWIIRQKSDDEQKKFDVMKKNIEEDLAFKSNIIKKLEERNEAAVSQFNLRLASSTTSYNQVCKKLEEAEERISFLRDMNSQDKKRLEKDIDNRNKEISRLQSVKTFVEGLGIDCDKLEEALPEIKKKLSEFENLQTTLNDMLEKNKELDEECEFMNKQIEFLETRNTEMFKKNLEMTENEERLKKELADSRELVDRSNRLQEEIDTLKLSVSQYIQALDASELRMNQTLQKLSEAELKNNQLQNAYKVLEANLESRNQKILHYVSEMKNYEKMLTEKTKMNQEVRLALEEERSKYEDLALQKSSKEKDLIALQKELSECHARLKELGSRLEMATDLEAGLNKVSAERDEALRLYNELKSKLPIAQQMIRSKESLVASLQSSYEKLEAEKKENEDILKARERELEAKIQVLKTEASDKTVRIVQLESLIESSQTSPLESYKNKITSLENEVETLKTELSRNLVSMSPRHIHVDAVSLANQQDTVSRDEHRIAISKLEKKETVLKRLCKQRREKILLYEDLLRQNNINVPNISTDHSH
uniref:Uncharacterized protein n=1 Tax=Lygus hesperus TaxID=30085 RepID=A0A0A9ZFT7_LYGHE